MAKNPSIQPLHDRVVVKPKATDEVSASGIIIPDTAKKERAEQGTVVAVGPGRYEKGALVPMAVKKGDEVIFEQTYRDPIEIDGEEYYIFSESSILAIIPQK
jgi:chaperonin GroES